MIYSSNFIAILDACVLYPAPLRDLLLSLADGGLFKPKWTDEIQDEWIRNLVENRPDLKREQLIATTQAMNTAFPDSNVENYEALIEAISLPDPGDRHVVAAAIRSTANVIVTFNLKDFPSSITEEFDIDVQHPDSFLSNVYDLNPTKAKEAFRKQVRRLKNPPKTTSEVLIQLQKSDLGMIVEKLKDVR